MLDGTALCGIKSSDDRAPCCVKDFLSQPAGEYVPLGVLQIRLWKLVNVMASNTECNFPHSGGNFHCIQSDRSCEACYGLCQLTGHVGSAEQCHPRYKCRFNVLLISKLFIYFKSVVFNVQYLFNRPLQEPLLKNRPPLMIILLAIIVFQLENIPVLIK